MRVSEVISALVAAMADKGDQEVMVSTSEQEADIAAIFSDCSHVIWIRTWTPENVEEPT